MTLGVDGQHVCTIEGLNDVLVARGNPGAVLAAIADPGVKIVTLTVGNRGTATILQPVR